MRDGVVKRVGGRGVIGGGVFTINNLRRYIPIDWMAMNYVDLKGHFGYMQRHSLYLEPLYSLAYCLSP